MPEPGFGTGRKALSASLSRSLVAIDRHFSHFANIVLPLFSLSALAAAYTRDTSLNILRQEYCVYPAIAQ